MDGGTAGDTREFPRLAQGSRGKVSFFPGSILMLKIAKFSRFAMDFDSQGSLGSRDSFVSGDSSGHVISLTHWANRSRVFEPRDFYHVMWSG